MCFAFFFFVLFCHASKASENLTFILKQSLTLSRVVVVIYLTYGVYVMKIKSAPQIALDLFQNCDFREELVKLLM